MRTRCRRNDGDGATGGRDSGETLDLRVVGNGPAGLSAGCAAILHKLRDGVIEQEDSLGGAVCHHPRNKVTMTAPEQLPPVG